MKKIKKLSKEQVENSNLKPAFPPTNLYIIKLDVNSKIQKWIFHKECTNSEVFNDELKEANHKASILTHSLTEPERKKGFRFQVVRMLVFEYSRANKFLTLKEQQERIQQSLYNAVKLENEIDTSVKSAKEQRVEKAKKTVTSKRDTSKPGVIETIRKFFNDFKTKEECLIHLTSIFPEREPAKMKNTINANLSWGFVGKGYKILTKEVKGVKKFKVE